MGASLTMIDRHYGHLARDGCEHAIRPLDAHAGSESASVHGVVGGWTPEASTVSRSLNGRPA
jgi:hypothetical protein